MSKPALDVGIGLERVITDHVNFRIELGYTTVFFRDHLIFWGTMEPHRSRSELQPVIGDWSAPAPVEAGS